MSESTEGVLLLNLGGPDTLEAVRPFLFNLFSDREIIRLGPAPLQKPLAWLIATLRSKKTCEAYQLIGGGSPIRRITESQAHALQESLNRSHDFRVYVGMRYWHPFISDTMQKMHEEGIRRFCALSLYPHYSKATTGSAYREVERNLEKYPMECVFTDPWFDNSLYIDAVVKSITDKITRESLDVHILYSAHSLPESFIDEGDPYVDHILKTIDSVNKTLLTIGYRIHSYLGYQSRSGPVKWLSPSTDEMIEELGGKGIEELIVVPISFVSDHIETLYEVDILYRDLALKQNMKLSRVESLNVAPLFIEALEDIVLKARPEKTGVEK